MTDALTALFSALTPLWEMSLTGAYAAGIVFLLRLMLKNRAPRQAVCLLWLIVFARLLLPFSFQAPFSAVPQALAEGQQALLIQETAPENSPALPSAPAEDTQTEPQTEPQTGAQVYPSGQDTPSVIAPLPGSGQQAADPAVPAQPTAPAPFPWRPLVAGIWLAGTLAMLGYALISWLLLRRRLFDAVRILKNVWEHPSVTSPFLLGLFRPRIYLPCGVPQPNRAFILCHELTHLRRGDHMVKPVCWLALSLHWFNPMAWLAFLLLSRDLEAACDQAVIRQIGAQYKQAYSTALLTVASGQKFPAPCPLAFGGSGIRDRIKTVLAYHRPALWIVLVGAVTVAAAAACLLTDPIAQADRSPDSSGFSVEPLGSPSGGTYTRFRLVYEGQEAEFSGTALADIPPLACAEDLNGDDIPELIAVLTVREDASRFLQEVHVFDSQTLTEYPCGDLATTAGSSLTVSANDQSYFLSAADGFTREVPKSSLPFPTAQLLDYPAPGDYCAFSVEDGALACTIGLRATQSDYAGYLTVTLALKEGRFRPDGYAWTPAQAVTERLLPPPDDPDLPAPDFLDEEQQELYRSAHTLYTHLFGNDTGEGLHYWNETAPDYGEFETVELDGAIYTRAQGRFARWDDFEAAVQTLFTDDFFQSHNRNGTEPALYVERDGALYFRWLSLGGGNHNDNFPDTFELVERTADRISFTVTGHYASPYPFPDESYEERDNRLASSYEYTLTFPITLVRTPAGWRFDQFSSPLVDDREALTGAQLLREGDSYGGAYANQIFLWQAGDKLLLEWYGCFFELSQPITRNNLTGLYTRDLDGDGTVEGVVTYEPNGSAAPVITVYELTKGRLTAHSYDTANVLEHFAGSSVAAYQIPTETLIFTHYDGAAVSDKVYLPLSFFEDGDLAPEDVYYGYVESVSELTLAGGGFTAVLRPVLADHYENPTAVTADPIGRLDYPITYTGTGFELGIPALTLFSHPQDESGDLPTLIFLADALRGSSPISVAHPLEELWLDPSDPIVELDGQRLDIAGFTLADLDGDGNREAVLQLGLPGGYDTYGYLVLRTWFNGSVAGYMQTYRGLMRLKSDGTFSYSNGAFDHGVARLNFQGGYTELDVLAGIESDGAGSVLGCTVDGLEATMEDFEAALAEQDAKADAVWYEYTEHNLLTLLP